MKKQVREGIAVAGSVIVDKINEIAAYPESGELAQIVNIEQSVGGCVPNVAIDLKHICPDMPVMAIGKIGKDEDGLYVSDVLCANGIDVTGLVVDEGKHTSFTNVMSVKGGQRTFFTYAGASAEFGVGDVDFRSLNAKMLHLGYFLLLEKVDQGEGLSILKQAKAQGMRTSIDLVSENSERYSIVIPCLNYTDYLIINETEAGKIANMEPRAENLRTIAGRLKEMGVKEKVIIHQPDRAVCLSEKEFMVVPSYRLPETYIRGTTGAGDAFCAGTLIGLYKGWSDRKILEFASACAAVSLGEVDATSGLKEASEIRKICQQFSRRELEV